MPNQPPAVPATGNTNVTGHEYRMVPDRNAALPARGDEPTAVPGCFACGSRMEATDTSGVWWQCWNALCDRCAVKTRIDLSLLHKRTYQKSYRCRFCEEWGGFLWLRDHDCPSEHAPARARVASNLAEQLTSTGAPDAR